MNTIKETITNMLKEDTGTHFLDSGGTNNRHHQKNKNINFDELPSVEFDIYNNEIDYTINLYHYLMSANLELDTKCHIFNKLQDNSNDWDATGEHTECYGVSFKAWNYLKINNYDVNVLNTWNTYNGQTFLSQVLQGSYLDINGESYVLFQVHGGADVRGGYTNAKLFKMKNFQEWLPSESIYGDIDGVSVDNCYDGYNITDGDGNEVEIKKDSKINLYLMES